MTVLYSKLMLPKNPAEDFLNTEEWLRLGDAIKLSDRERGVAQLIFEGRTRAQVARNLGCAPGTVRVYIDRLFVKLNVGDRVGLVLRLVRIHLQLAANPTSHKNAT